MTTIPDPTVNNIIDRGDAKRVLDQLVSASRDLANILSRIPGNLPVAGSRWHDGQKLTRALIVSEAPRAVAISREGEETVWSARTRRWHGPGGRPDIESDDAVYGPWDLVHVLAPDDDDEYPLDDEE